MTSPDRDFEPVLALCSKEPRPTDPTKPTIGFLIPPSTQVCVPERAFGKSAPFEGITSVGTVLENAGYPVRIFDLRNAQDPYQATLAASDSVDILAPAVYFDSYCFLRDVLPDVRARNPKVKIVFGGPLISSDPDLVMRHLQGDVAVLGEGELTILHLLETIERGGSVEDVPGLAYRQNGHIALTAKRAQIRRIDNLPDLSYHLWPNAIETGFVPKIFYSSTRGCYYKCAFCYRTIDKFRRKSNEKVEREISTLIERYNVKHVWLNDLTFVAYRNHAEMLCNLFKKFDVIWSCTTRVQEVNPEILAVMAESGCNRIEYGIEAFDQKVVDGIHKEFTLEEARKAVKNTIAAGIICQGLFIIGLPNETRESLEALYQYCLEEPQMIPRIKYLVPFPGTEIYQLCLSKGLIKDEQAYLELISRRKLTDDDDIVNVTDLPTEVLREYYRKIWSVREERQISDEY